MSYKVLFVKFLMSYVTKYAFVYSKFSLQKYVIKLALWNCIVIGMLLPAFIYVHLISTVVLEVVKNLQCVCTRAHVCVCAHAHMFVCVYVLSHKLLLSHTLHMYIYHIRRIIGELNIGDSF